MSIRRRLVSLLVVVFTLSIAPISTFAAPQAVPAAQGRPALSRGSTGPYVVEAQQRLNIWINQGRTGLTLLPANGTFGPQTERTVVAFQKAKGLPQVGSIGPRTWAELPVLSGSGGSTATAPAQPSKGTVITHEPGSVGRGYRATVAIKTAPGANCSITVQYKSGPSVAQGLYDQTAPSSGVLSWSWKVGTRTTPGSWPVYINCGSAGRVTTYLRVP